MDRASQPSADRAAGPSDLSPFGSSQSSIADAVRDSRGRFTKLVCVNAHDRCFGGAGGPCPLCEPRETTR